MRQKTQRERAAKRASRQGPIWCECCQDAPATAQHRECFECGYTEILPLELAQLLGPMKCPNCTPPPRRRP
jgi:uncharacterized paraquat-inducible protein A